MFEATLAKAGLMKQILEAIKELVENANFDCQPEGLQVQAMDMSHVTLVSLVLYASGFETYRCDRQQMLGIKIGAMSKILKCANNDDRMTMKAEDAGEEISFLFEASKLGRVSAFDMKLMEIDSDALGIPDQKFTSIIKMPSAEFQRICRDLQTFGDYVTISVTKGDVTFSVTGEMGSGHVRLNSNAGVDVKEEESVTILCDKPLSLSFALRFLCYFTKATPLSQSVTLSMVSEEVPLVVDYPIAEEKGSIKFFLAPKFEEEN